MRPKNQAEIITIKCGCASTDNANGVIFEIISKNKDEAKIINRIYDEIKRLKEEAIKSVDNKTDQIDLYIKQYNSILMLLEKYSLFGFKLSWKDEMYHYIILISRMLVLQYFNIIPVDKEHYFRLKNNSKRRYK
jgi:hypothetical protein